MQYEEEKKDELFDITNILSTARDGISDDLEKLSDEEREEVETELDGIEEQFSSIMHEKNLKKMIKKANKKKKTRFRDIKKKRI